MKTKMTMLLAMICTLSLSAQDNNRMNDIGKQFLPSLNLIKSDVSKGTITEITQGTLDYYASVIPLKAEMKLELATDLYNLKKAGQLKFSDFVNNATGISQTSKDFILKIATPRQALIQKLGQQYYPNLVNEIGKSNVSGAEKDMLLALTSIAFNVKSQNRTESSSFGEGEAGYCTVTGPDGTTPVNADDCVLLAAAVGFVFGFQTCGVWCGVGGAIVFGVIAAISVC